ncbi:aromatic ring-hydroxylating oxygenase subunit alpha [Sphingomonas lycopersici]|uniref:Aromatic ring-hydroxylating dioxygenase subunit alpha n=1 Tax=Sphingomonas lycopersici TaxID=2951807 RepID=A0AA41ZAI9_9SPHN|nr:aromatic ring-hydroxylating dioxygenase subunit alpha [Sphingomonas lycopersici]MCW6536962.1 aromatic ring-hydroxylating dioxygenase subunit alpha [Sphingomonas lycopersici]
MPSFSDINLNQLDMRAAMSLAPDQYTRQDVLNAELEKIFAREWLCVGRAADIPEPGDYLVFDHPRVAVMAVRQKNGDIAVLSRVCRHRGALVAEDSGGSARLFVCPYHKWTYDLDGTLRGAPAMSENSAFDRTDCALPRFRTEIWQGFVFFSLDPNIAPLAPKLAALSERLAAYDLAELATGFTLEEIWDSNWKVAFENSCESYHHMGVHGSTLEPIFPTGGVRCEPGSEAFNIHAVPTIAGFTLGGAEGNANDRPENRALVVAGIYPAMTIALTGPTATWFSFTPIDAGHTRVRVGWLVRHSDDHILPRPDQLARDRALLATVLREDRASCAAVQRGLATADAAAGPLSPLEQPVAEFAQYLRQRLGLTEAR